MKKYIEENGWDISSLIEKDDVQSLKQLLHRFPEILNIQVLDERTLLHLAAEYSAIDCAKLLLESGADIEVTDWCGTPLINAARAESGNIEMVKLLLAAGAHPDGHPLSSVTPLNEAIFEGHREIAKLLLEFDIDINRIQQWSNTPLNTAEWRLPELVPLLKEKGARRAMETIQLENVEGSGILQCIYHKCGPILTDEYLDENINIKTALIQKGKQCPKYKLLFTFGNYKTIPRKEFLLCLPEHWRLNQAIFKSNHEKAFPLKFLFRLSELYRNGEMMNEGTVIERNDEKVLDLAWPDGIDAFVFVDYVFDRNHIPIDEQKNEKNLEDDNDDEIVELLLLVPLKYPKTGRPKAEKLSKWVERKRTVKWDSVSMIKLNW